MADWKDREKFLTGGAKKSALRFKLGKQERRRVLIYLATVVFSFLFLFFGNRIASGGIPTVEGADRAEVVKAEVIAILSRESQSYALGGAQTVTGTSITFSAQVVSGPRKGQVCTAVQTNDPFTPMQQKEIAVGDKVLLHSTAALTGADEVPGATGWMLGEYVRTDALAALLGAFLALILLFGRGKGLNTIVSLGFTCAAVFLVFIPSILSGRNIYFWSVLTCVFVIAMTLLIVAGADRKSLASALGCTGGVLFAGFLTVFMDHFLRLTGFLNEESTYLSYLGTEKPIDLKAIIFAAIIIGAMGAIMDVSMSISSSLWELREKLGGASPELLFRSGVTIGRDIMGTMANTLVLAYIGSSLSSVLLLIAYNESMLALLNREKIVVEILQSLTGSFGILIALPLTSLICALLYGEKKAPSSPDAPSAEEQAAQPAQAR